VFRAIRAADVEVQVVLPRVADATVDLDAVLRTQRRGASGRSQRVADLVRSELSLLLLTEAHDPDVKTVTITEVEMPPDLKSARVYYTSRGDEAALARAGEGLARAAGYLRREVGRRCGLRYAPELFFQPDRSYERGARIDELLSQVLPEREEEP